MRLCTHVQYMALLPLTCSYASLRVTLSLSLIQRKSVSAISDDLDLLAVCATISSILPGLHRKHLQLTFISEPQVF